MYYILLGICYLLAALPFFILYGISDFCYLLVYHVFGYRKAVILANLKQAFPEKTDAEIKTLAAKYYRNLTDMMVETIKLLTISKKNLQRRFDCDLTVLHDLYAKGKSCQLHLGHNFNWEWANVFCMQGVAFPFLVVYMPLTNKTADRLFRYFRERAGTVLLPANDMSNAMAPWHQKQYLVALVADQNPGNPRRTYWYPFLNKMTAFYKGPEMSARRYNIPVVFADIRKVKRGYYKARLVLASENPKNTPEGQLTEQFVQFLEANIREQPEVWVWSHRRWKHKWKGEMNEASKPA
ncbi:KDO2-lipid IV(A) lauroyltransferase [Chitinophaga costaii]|uniref:KDO2-lipid IV(A) lauroyltransferase n=1 Tax=Chitinophaga costaii TaxID=1335309 RepID=A0A1C4FS61_9BACT|nr:lysophospholipid acyltransferase family protein [Chitinophaga costaii]PUZ20481.1 lipid A biosynthesis acyltransferase [Chitinophaga costaii]SCC58435.1 KDO2-lipid IV(A) lauroyltransferase [Chitinophaga costaii]